MKRIEREKKRGETADEMSASKSWASDSKLIASASKFGASASKLIPSASLIWKLKKYGGE